MAGTIGHADHPLTWALLLRGHQFAFFQAVRLLHDLQPERVELGRQGPPGKEPVRLTGWLSLAFPAGDVCKIEKWEAPPEDEEAGRAADFPPYRMESPLLAIYGTTSPLPACYTEALFKQDVETERGFLDLFQHRLLSLLWRAWARYRWEVGFKKDASDFFSNRLTRFTGLGKGALPEGHRSGRMWLLALAGLLTFEPRGAAGMALALRRLFPTCQVEVEPFAPRWVALPQDDLSRLGNHRCVLGRTSVSGERVLDRAGTFRVVLTTPDARTYLAFLEPEGPLVALRELVDLFNPDLLDCELELRLHEQAVLEPRLGAPDVRLGWSSWIGRTPPEDRWIRRLFIGAFHG